MSRLFMFTRGWNTTHVIYNHMQHAQVEGSRSTALDVACRMVVACACRDRMAAAEGRKACCKSPAAALTCRCVLVVRRCVAHGDVHGDASTVIYKVRKEAPAT